MKYSLKSLHLLVLLIITHTSLCQPTELGATQGAGIINSTPGGMITEIRPSSTGVTGSTYLDNDWLTGKIDLVNGCVINDLPMRYDILANQIEVKIDGTIKGVNGKNIKSFTYHNPKSMSTEVFVSGANFQQVGIPHSGFFKLITKGEWSLFEKTEVVYLKPTYNAALAVGNINGSYAKKSIFYITGVTSAFVVSKNKKKFLKSFNERTEALKAFMKEKNLSLKETEDIKLIVEFLNTRN